MYRIITLVSITTLLAACSAPSTDLELLKQQRDSLMKVQSTVKTALQAVDNEMAELDTTQDQRLMTITTLALEPTRFEHFFEVQGVVETDQNVLIYPEVGAKITSISVKEGQEVAKGQVLMTMDSKIVRNQIAELKSRLQLAKTVFEKQQLLWEQKIGSEIQYLEAKNNYESLQQNIETLEAQQSLYTITAPFSGTVDEILPKVGEMANPAMPAMRLINMNGAYLKADVTERYLGQIQAGDSVMLHFPGVGVTSASHIERIGSYINPGNRTFKIRVNAGNSTEALRPNLLAEIKIRDYTADSVAVIPTSIIQMTPSGKEFVYIYQSGTAVKRTIKTGMSYNGFMEVTEGLGGNEVLILKGARSVKDGDEVKVEA